MERNFPYKANEVIHSKHIRLKLQILLGALLVAVVFLNSCSKKPQKVYRVGILCGLDYISVIPDSFKAKMTELGYIEDRNIVYDIHRTNFEPEREKQILSQFVKDDVDLIVTFPTEVSMFAKAATEGTDVPVGLLSRADRIIR